MCSFISLDDSVQSGFVDVVELGSLHQCSRFQEVIGRHSQFARHVIDVDRLGGGNAVDELTAEFAEADKLQSARGLGEWIEDVETLEVFFDKSGGSGVGLTE